LLVVTTACNNEEDAVAPQEEFPDFISALENFDDPECLK